MLIASTWTGAPFKRREDITAEDLEREKDIYRARTIGRVAQV